MSDSESSYAPTTDDESYYEFQEDLEHMSAMIEGLTQAIHSLESQMGQFHRPLENLHLSQLGSLPFLTSSPFRHAAFALKPPGFPGVDLSQRYPYHTLCSMLRNYLFASGAVAADGTITLSKQLQTLFGIPDERTDFITLLGALRNVCV